MQQYAPTPPVVQPGQILLIIQINNGGVLGVINCYGIHLQLNRYGQGGKSKK